MSYIQVIPFNQAQGGTTPNLCLANVSKGYVIPNKYGSAWEAWQHTQQHPDRNIPAGLAVPLYYSYTAIIDGVTANYGHINVQLPNGTVWSDGNIYASIDAYTANHYPKFVGWGESVNDVTIIQGSNNMSITTDQLYELIRGIAQREPTQAEASNQDYLNNPGLAIDTFWRNGGSATYGSPVFNEGDAINFNDYFYGKDKGQFRGEVGQPFKQAAYNIQEQLKNDKALLVNDGDVANLSATGISNAAQANGTDWKSAVYSVILENLPATTINKQNVINYITKNLN